jgi:hypothetical protein
MMQTVQTIQLADALAARAADLVRTIETAECRGGLLSVDVLKATLALARELHRSGVRAPVPRPR